MPEDASTDIGASSTSALRTTVELNRSPGLMCEYNLMPRCASWVIEFRLALSWEMCGDLVTAFDGGLRMTCVSHSHLYSLQMRIGLRAT